MCYYFKETQTISKLLTIAIVVILIVGIIGGIVLGVALREPEIDRGYYSSTVTGYSWTPAGVGAMIAVWVYSAISALFMWAFKHKIELNDMTAGSLKNIEVYTKRLLEAEQE